MKEKIKSMSKEALKTLEIHVDEHGFSIWIIERRKDENVRYWLVDGSTLKRSGTIQIGTIRPDYAYHAIWDGNGIQLVQNESKVEVISREK